MTKIVLDAGHGAGIEFNRGGLLFNEGDQNFRYSLLLKEELEKYSGIEVFLTRNKITDNPDLDVRGKMYPSADLFISLHTNAFSDSMVHGTETFVSLRNDEKLATLINDITVKTLGTVNRGVKRRKNENGKDWYGVLRNSSAKYSILIEHVFHTNLADSKVFLNNQRKLAQAQAKVIAEYYNKNLKSAVLSQTTTSDVLYRVSTGAYKEHSNAVNEVDRLKKLGIEAYISAVNVTTQRYTKPALKPISEIAKEVLEGEWGNGETRRERLEEAGYNYSEVQSEVNKLI